jgi:triacylglycerol lipase
MTLELIPDALGDVRNARYLATASNLAYFNEAEGAPQFEDTLGLDAKLISVDHTQVYVGSDTKNIVVAFRGTEDPTTLDGLKDTLLTDALNLLMVPEGRLGTDFAAAGVGARFHQGFITALASVWDPLLSEVDSRLKESDRLLWITGHSLGGALALLSAWLFMRKMIDVHQVYTFGAPMVGNVKALAAFDKELAGKIYRYCNETDPIPMLPSLSLMANEYSHCQKLMGLSTTAGTLGVLLTAIGAKALDGLIHGALIEETWGEIKSRLNNHFLTSYFKLVDELEHKG